MTILLTNKLNDLLVSARQLGGHVPAPRYQLTTFECRVLCALHNLKLATVASDWSFMLTKQGEAKADELIKKEGDHV